MRQLIRFSKSILSKKDNNDFNNTYNSDYMDLIKSKEESLSELIDVNNTNLSHLENTKAIYQTLIRYKNFKEFILLYELDKEKIISILKTGILKSYNLKEEIIKKKTKPQFYFLVLKGIVSYDNVIYIPGSFFGDEILKDTYYNHNAEAQRDDTTLLLFPKESFNEHLKNNIINTNDKIKNLLISSFDIFQTFDNSTIEKYREKKMTKIFPETGEMIISNNEIADAFFIIYKGSCSLNIGENLDLMILSQDNLFGIESLNNIDEKGNLMNNQYLYNIINKSPDTIIFKFPIINLNKAIIIDLKTQLTPSLLERNEVLQKHEKMKEDLKNKLVKQYNSLEGMKYKKKLLLKFYKELSSEEAENSYNKEYNNIRQQHLFSKDKQKITHMNSSLIMKNVIKKKYLFDKPKKSNSCFNLLENEKNPISERRKKIMSNILLKKDSIDLKKIVLNLDLKKLIHNKAENANKKNIKNIPNSYKTFNEQKIFSKDSIFFTNINMNRNKKKREIYRTISVLNSKENSNYTYRKRLISKIKKEKEDCSTAKDDESNTIIGSTFRDSISYNKKRKYISVKKQIETYGCTALDSMNYFNYGKKENSLYSVIYENNKNKINSKKCLFYETNKYNLPLFVLCDKNEPTKLPEIINNKQKTSS